MKGGWAMLVRRYEGGREGRRKGGKGGRRGWGDVG